MTYSQLWRPNLAGLYYTLALGVAYKRHQWIWDPDYASVQDHEAWIKIRRDANTAAAIHKRRASVAALDWSVQAASDDPADELCARLQEGMLGSIRQPWMARYLQTEAIFRGSAYQFVEGEWRWLKMKGDVRVRRWWIPTRLRHVDRWRFRLEPLADRPGNSAATQWELFHVGAQEWRPLRHAQWFVSSTYEDSEDTLGYGRGLLQAIFFYWRAKEVAFTQGLSGLERWSQGILHYAMEGKRPGSIGRDNDTVRDAAIDELKKHRSEHILVHDKEDDLEVLTGGMEGHQICSWFMEYLDRGIDRVCMQGSLPTGGGPSDAGSYGRAETEAGEGQATYQADRRMLAEDYDHSLMDLGWRLNLGNLIDACRDRGLALGTRGKIHLADETREDPREVAAGVQTLIAVPGMKLIKREVYERTGWTMPRGDEETIGGEAPGGLGAPGMAGPVAGAGAPAAAISGPPSIEGDLDQALRGLVETSPSESMSAYAGEMAGQPCTPGHTAERDGCIPVEDGAGAQPGSAAPASQAPSAPSAPLGDHKAAVKAFRGLGHHQKGVLGKAGVAFFRGSSGALDGAIKSYGSVVDQVKSLPDADLRKTISTIADYVLPKKIGGEQLRSAADRLFKAHLAKTFLAAAEEAAMSEGVDVSEQQRDEILQSTGAQFGDLRALIMGEPIADFEVSTPENQGSEDDLDALDRFTRSAGPPSLTYDAGQPCKPGERADMTGCVPREGTAQALLAKRKAAAPTTRAKAIAGTVAGTVAGKAKGVVEKGLARIPGTPQQKAAREKFKTDLAAATSALEGKVGGKLGAREAADLVGTLTDAGLGSKAARQALASLEGDTSMAQGVARRAIGLGRTINKTADKMIAPMVKAGVPPRLAKAVAFMAAADAALPITFTSTALMILQGPAAVANPLFWTPGAIEGGGIVAATIVGTRAAKALKGVMSRKPSWEERRAEAKWSKQIQQDVAAGLVTEEEMRGPAGGETREPTEREMADVEARQQKRREKPWAIASSADDIDALLYQAGDDSNTAAIARTLSAMARELDEQEQAALANVLRALAATGGTAGGLGEMLDTAFAIVKDASPEELEDLASEPEPGEIERMEAELGADEDEGAEYDAGQPCKPGERADMTGCVPASGETSTPSSSAGEPIQPAAKPRAAKAEKKPARKKSGSQLAPEVRSRLEELGVKDLPPAYVPSEDVRILQDLANPDPMQALLSWPETSRSGRASTKRAYTPAFHEANASKKWQRVRAIEGQVDAFRAQLGERITALEPGSREHQRALVAGVIAATGLRPGWSKDSVAHGHFGFSTIRPEHVTIEGDRVLLDFVGKEGVRNVGEINDPVLVGAMRGYLERSEPGTPLFPKANATAVRKEMPKGWKVKDLRTVMAAKVARAAIARHQPPPPPLPAKGAKRIERAAIVSISTAVSKQLNNKPAQAEKSYILPEILNAFRDRLREEESS